MLTELSLHPAMFGPISSPRSLGTRPAAIPYRQQIETSIELGKVIVLDFAGVEATQSFVDELIGVVVLHHGRSVLELVKFRGCSDDMKAVIRFVISDRARQHDEEKSASRPVFH
ncbi:hypothetical protein J2X19_000135 [Rhodoferax ferrireducens]|uniref:DUF4325 domain-containing protein n=1 Tax=Rhodoferax ferrireducens TaxID=192843 RepID=A0ABU2C2D1_9BURK|nr:STAS-like domain-containing protein [Rhodoferax ferrireducens]MDR7375477.1 hypothetical protein [Rhodoferax ferrireducens]